MGAWVYPRLSPRDVVFLVSTSRVVMDLGVASAGKQDTTAAI